MMFDFSGPETTCTASGPVDTPGDDPTAVGDGDCRSGRSQAEPPRKKRDLSSSLPAEEKTAPPPDAVTALLPIINEITHQVTDYTSAMETAVRDLASSENDQKQELQRLLDEARQVLAAHGQMKRRFNGRLGAVSRVLRAAQSPSQP